MRTIPLSESKSVVLNAAGNGTVTLTPPPHQTWNVLIANVRIPNAVIVPQLILYVGDSATDANRVDSTYLGNNNTSDALRDYPIQSGTNVIAVWSGGDVGAVATLTLRGTKTVP